MPSTINRNSQAKFSNHKPSQDNAEFTLLREDLILRGGVDATLEKLAAATEALDAAALAAGLKSADHWKMSAHPDEKVRKCAHGGTASTENDSLDTALFSWTSGGMSMFNAVRPPPVLAWRVEN